MGRVEGVLDVCHIIVSFVGMDGIRWIDYYLSTYLKQCGVDREEAVEGVLDVCHIIVSFVGIGYDGLTTIYLPT